MKSGAVASPHRGTQEILDSIRRIVRALRVASRLSEKALGLSGAQLYVLQKLGESEGCSINQLAERTLTHQSSVSVVVGRLARRKLAVRRKSRQDARRAEIFLTAKGRALLRRAPEPVQARLVGAIDALPRADRTKLARNLATIVEAAGIGEGPAPLFFEEMAQ